MSMLSDLRKVLKGKSFLLEVKIKPVYREHIDSNRMIFFSLTDPIFNR